MILEGVVTTSGTDGRPHLAPMGPRVAFRQQNGELRLERFLLRPFQTSQTYQNLTGHPEGVLHVIDDVLLLARAAVGAAEPLPVLLPADHIRGWVLADCCRYHEFRVVGRETHHERAELTAEVVHTGRRRDFFGFNRAKHAVVEAAILATRTAFIPLDEIAAEYRKFAILVDKTGGPQEQEALRFLQQRLDHLREKSA